MSKRALILAGSAALIAAPASAVGDFRLPPSGDQPSAPPVVGPVDPDRPVPRPTPTPTPRPTPTPTPTPAPVITLPAATPAARTTPAVRPSPAPARTTGAETPAEAGAPPQDAATTTPFPAFTPAPSSPPETVAAEDEGGLPWPWIAGFGLLAALLAGGWWWLRRRMLPGGTVLIVPEIEKPRVPEAEPAAAPEPAPESGPEPFAEPALAAAPADPARPAHPLQITLEPLKLTQTVMNASLIYKLALTNRGEAPLAGVSVSADLVAAHASLPREALMAAPDTDLPQRHEVAAIDPGATVVLKGELRLPLAQAMPIRQGQAVVFVPLARFRASAEGTDPRCFTVVVGQPSPRGALQPVRLDLGPRSTEGLTGHAF